MFLSLKKHWESRPEEVGAALLELGRSLLRAMRLHGVHGNLADLQQFQETMLALEQRLDADPEPRDVLNSAGEASRAIEAYSLQTNRYLEAHSAELASILSMLTGTVEAIAEGGRTAAAEWGRIEKRMDKLAQLTDPQQIKTELAACLSILREEAARQRRSNERVIAGIQKAIAESSTRLAEAGVHCEQIRTAAAVLDTVTGLPTRPDCENALGLARVRPYMYAAVLPVDRLNLIQSRFGDMAVERVVMFFANYVRAHMQSGDLLFRWSKGAFVAVVSRPLPADTVRADLSRFASAKLEFPLEHHGREIILPVSSSWTLFPITDSQAPETLFGKIDAFLRSEMHVKESF